MDPGARKEQGKLVALDVREGDRILFGKFAYAVPHFATCAVRAIRWHSTHARPRSLWQRAEPCARAASSS
jgi:hypothetical protein